MSSNQAIQLQLQPKQGQSGTPSVWVRLEQDAISEVDQYASFYDLSQMLSMARSGLPAWAYGDNDCPFSTEDGVVKIFLDFYSWPSDMLLQYSLSASIGELDEWQRVEEQKEFDLVIPETDRVDLPYLMAPVTVEWQTPAFDHKWRIIPRPAVTFDGSALVFPEPVFGVLRVRGTAHGYKHRATIEIEKEVEALNDAGELVVETYRIENLQCNVIAGWRDENGDYQTDSLELQVPECVEDYLATCPDGDTKHGGLTITQNGGRRTVVYYNSCTGKIIMVRDEVQ